MTDDRRVHAEGMVLQIVRYDRAGKWWSENMLTGARTPLTLDEAVTVARGLAVGGGKVHLKLPGGGAFDARYRRLVEKEAL